MSLPLGRSDMSYCDHEQYRDHRTGVIFLSCFCFCGLCYDQSRMIQEGNGCICDECFCNELPINVDCRGGQANLMLPESVTKLPKIGGKPVETVVSDLPEQPGKTGTCRTCGAPTYRKEGATKGRFPSLCEGCK